MSNKSAKEEIEEIIAQTKNNINQLSRKVKENSTLEKKFYQCKKNNVADWVGALNDFSHAMSDYFVNDSSQEQNQDDDLQKDEYDDSDEWYKMF